MPDGWVMPIQSAQPDVATNATPANRMPQPPDAPPRTRNSNHGPNVSMTDVPREKAAMMAAPFSTLADSEATNNAE